MELSVVIPTYNQGDLLRRCLRSVTRQTLSPPTYEVIVVDDGSTDRTREVIDAFRPAGVVAVHLPTNRGRSAARNAGIDAARAPLIVFTDSDVAVRPDFLYWHLETHRAHGPRVLCRGPVVLVHDRDDVTNRPLPKGIGSPAYLDTANASVEKSALVEVGGFDESFPGYGWEDFELGLRLRQAGIRRVFRPEAMAFHVQPDLEERALDLLLRKEAERAKSAAHFFKKHPRAETRLLIQATPVHRVLYWLLAAGGMLTPSAALRIAQWCHRSGVPSAGHLVLRMALNWRYAKFLQSELTTRA